MTLISVSLIAVLCGAGAVIGASSAASAAGPDAAPILPGPPWISPGPPISPAPPAPPSWPAPELTAAPTLCVAAGARLNVEVRFNAAFQNRLELRLGERVVRRFDNWFDRGAHADQGPGAWRSTVFAEDVCFRVLAAHRPGGSGPWRSSRWRRDGDRISFEDDVDGDYDDAEIVLLDDTPTS